MTDRSDEETVELIREFLQKYGLTIVAGIVLGLAIVGGYQWWEKHQLNQRYDQSAQLDALFTAVQKQQFATAEKLYPALQQAGNNISELAGLVMAHGYVLQGKKEKALAVLEQTAAEGKDLLVQQTANWQAANLATELKQYDRASAFLIQLEDSPYKGQAAALQGYLYQVQGKLPAALKAYQNSVDILPSPTVALQLNALAAQLAVHEK